MRIITGTKHKTITLTANELTQFTYDSIQTLDLYNASNNDIWLSADSRITPSIDNEDCMLLPADGGAYNCLKASSFTCISKNTAVIVVVERG